MKRFLLTLSICLLCLFAWNLSEASAITIEVDGVTLQSDTTPEIVNGRTFVPLRVIFEALNATVDWDDTNKIVSANKEDINLKIKIGSKKALLNNQEVILDEPAYISNGRTMVPVRFIGENFNYDVSWLEGTRQVILTKSNKPKDSDKSTEGITVIIDGKVSELSKYVKTGINEFTKEEIVIMPLDRLVKELNRYAEITYNGNDFVIATNNEIYKGWIGNIVLDPQLNPTYFGRSDYNELIDGEYYMDAEYVAIALKADYTYDRISKTITINTVNKNFDSNKYDFKVSSFNDLKEKLTHWLITTEEGKRELKVLLDFTLDPDNFKLTGINQNNIVAKTVADSHITLGLFFAFNDNNDGFINLQSFLDEQEEYQVLMANKKIKEITKKIIREGMSDREKVIALNNYIIDNLEYGYSEGRGLYGAIFEGKTVCGGYADMFVSMAYLSGLEVKGISGTVNGINHGWAAVKINGEWLHVDPTWNDSTPRNQYLLKTDAEMRSTHKWE